MTKRYSGCEVFEVSNQQHPESSFYEEIWMQVMASNDEEAQKMLLSDGLSKEDSFLNKSNDRIIWQFIGLKHVKELQSDSPIIELLSVSIPHGNYAEVKPEKTLGHQPSA